MVDSRMPDRADDVIEHEGMLWKPKPCATSSADEFIAARTLFLELHHDSLWNPWVLDDRAEELERAQQIMGEWKRGEPGHRTITTKQWEARIARQDREAKARQSADEARQARDRERYDPEREHARLSLLERRSRLEFELREVSGLRDGTSFPAMDPHRRAEQVTELEESIARLRTDIEQLTTIVGDPEDVVDKAGRLPKDRRQISLLYYKLDRESEVKRLRTEALDRQAPVKTATGRRERSELQAKLDTARRKLEKLLAIPPLTAEDMCADCAQPFAGHGWCIPPWDGPCPAWPSWAARLKKARAILEFAARSKQATQPPTPKPEPLAVIPSGLPIQQVIERLNELQRRYPDAEVRRGRANRWELWPPTAKPTSSPESGPTPTGASQDDRQQAFRSRR